MGRNINSYDRVPQPNLEDNLIGSRTGTGGTFNWSIAQILSLAEVSQPVTRAEMLDLISASNLVQGRWYVISDAVGSTAELLIQASNTNELNQICRRRDFPENLYKYDIASNTLTIFESGGGGDVEEAPVDGTIYGREDAGWLRVNETLKAEEVAETVIDFGLSLGRTHGDKDNPLSGDITLNSDNPLAGTSVFYYHQQATVPNIVPNGFDIAVIGNYLPNRVNKIIFTYTGDNDVVVIYPEQPPIDEQVLTISTGAITLARENGLEAFVTLTENVTSFGTENILEGDTIVLRVLQGGAGGFTLALPAGSKVINDGQGVIDLSGQEAGDESFITMKLRGGTFYVNYGLDYTSA